MLAAQVAQVLVFFHLGVAQLELVQMLAVLIITLVVVQVLEQVARQHLVMAEQPMVWAAQQILVLVAVEITLDKQAVQVW
jgi:hypothetical protein